MNDDITNNATILIIVQIITIPVYKCKKSKKKYIN